tara:strand:- start:166 stop:309 length:144 start_codon:yes stop_codon:yes gene_type:complete
MTTLASPQTFVSFHCLPYCPELNPVERFGGLIKAAVANRLYPNFLKL